MSAIRSAQSQSIKLQDPLEVSEEHLDLLAVLRDCLDALPDAVLRAKGWVRFDSAPSTAKLVQPVGRRWTLTTAPVGADTSESG